METKTPSILNYGLSIDRDVNSTSQMRIHHVSCQQKDKKVAQENAVRIDGDGMEKSHSQPLCHEHNETKKGRPSRELVPSVSTGDKQSKEIADIEKKINTIEANLKEEKTILKNHLEIQVQVNQEIKKLLVASLGADLASHYERLATEKAQISLENDELKAQIDERDDEIEKLNISCDIWRTKFLASRVQCDELHKSVWQYQQTLNEIDSSTRNIIHDNQITISNLQQTNAHLALLDEKLQLKQSDSKQNILENQSDLLMQELSASCLDYSKKIACHLLGKESLMPTTNSKYARFVASWKRINNKPTKQYEEEENLSIHEKRLCELLNNRLSEACDVDVATNTDRKKFSGRFHLQVNYEKLTINCCNHCCGEIKVV